MVRLLPFLFFGLAFVRCDSSRVYETNQDFSRAIWVIKDTATFVVPVTDTTLRYNLIMNIRNSIDFETTRIFIDYSLIDPNLKTIGKRLVEQNLFDRKTGEPFGNSSLGYIYWHPVILEPSIKFQLAGAYKIKLSHRMRTDTLTEILSVSIRLEKAQ